MLKVDIENLAAVTQEGTRVIGHLMWYSVEATLIQRDQLKGKLLNSGLEEKWMPNLIRLPDAFRRATSEIQVKKPVNSNVIENYLTREVYYDPKIIQRNIVLETVDQIKTLLNTVKLGLKGELKRPQVMETIEEAKRVANHFNSYRGIVEADVELMELYIEELRNRTYQMIKAL